MSIPPSECTSVGPPKSYSDLNEIWDVGRGRWVLHDGMPYDPRQGQGRRGLKCAKVADFLCQCVCNQKTDVELWYSKTINLNFNWTNFWYSSLFSVRWPSNNIQCSTFGKWILPLMRSHWLAIPYGSYLSYVIAEPKVVACTVSEQYLHRFS